MVDARYMSRLTLRRDRGSHGVLARLLEAGAGADAHGLVWSLFADGSDRPRDFLYRETGRGEFLALSARPPDDRHDLWRVETKEWAPMFRSGDRLQFSLRANPVVQVRDEAGRARRHDVVMHRRTRTGGQDRREAEAEAGFDWLVERGARAGFAVRRDEVRSGGYLQHRLPRPDGRMPIRFSTLDFDGMLTVTDVEAFQEAVRTGLGRSKGFGCGLLLLRRA